MALESVDIAVGVEERAEEKLRGRLSPAVIHNSGGKPIDRQIARAGAVRRIAGPVVRGRQDGIRNRDERAAKDHEGTITGGGLPDERELANSLEALVAGTLVVFQKYATQLLKVCQVPREVPKRYNIVEPHLRLHDTRPPSNGWGGHHACFVLPLLFLYLAYQAVYLIVV